MQQEFDILLDNNTLDQYEFFLSKFDIWKQYKRELKLSILLNEGKNIEFTVDIKSNNLNGTYLEFISNDKLDFDIQLVSHQNISKACAILNNIKFILNNNNVKSISINAKILNTSIGREVKKRIEDGFEIKAKQIFLSEGDYKFVKFYLTVS